MHISVSQLNGDVKLDHWVILTKLPVGGEEVGFESGTPERHMTCTLHCYASRSCGRKVFLPFSLSAYKGRMKIPRSLSVPVSTSLSHSH